MKPNLSSFGEGITVAVFGATGGIGNAIVKCVDECQEVSSVFAFSRKKPLTHSNSIVWSEVNFEQEESIYAIAQEIRKNKTKFDIIIIATGILHDKDFLSPEKTWSSLNSKNLTRLFSVNAIMPAIIAKHFLPLLNNEKKSVFSFLSARIGSINDNRSGGWHAYRASKAALNMLIKNFAIELARKNQKAICVGLHPGTVDTHLSKPFQRNINRKNLFTPPYAAYNLLNVINSLTNDNSGSLFAWDGNEIKP